MRLLCNDDAIIELHLRNDKIMITLRFHYHNVRILLLLRNDYIIIT